MGLDTSHDCWHGAYSAFMRWRQAVAMAAGLPPLDLMEGFYGSLYRDDGASLPTLYHGFKHTDDRYLERIDSGLPISWDCLKPSPLHELLSHSDCDGEIPWESCGPIADALEALLPEMEGMGDLGGHIGDAKAKTQTFIDGLRAAYTARENVEFY
jgi:hypothetical protein